MIAFPAGRARVDCGRRDGHALRDEQPGAEGSGGSRA